MLGVKDSQQSFGPFITAESNHTNIPSQFDRGKTLLGSLLRRAVPRSRLLRVVHMLSAVLLPWLTRPNFTTTLAPQHHVVLLFCTCTSSSHFQLSCPFSSCSNIALIWLLGAKYNCYTKISSFCVIRIPLLYLDSHFWRQSFLKTEDRHLRPENSHSCEDSHFYRQLRLQVATSKRVISENSHF